MLRAAEKMQLRAASTHRRQFQRLTHHARYKSRLAARRLDVILQKTARGLADIAGPRVGPRPALLVALADSLAGLTLGIVFDLDIAIVAAGPVGFDLEEDVARLDDARAAHTGNAATARHPWRHRILEPAYRVLITDSRIVETPGAAAAIALALQGADRGISGRHFRPQIIVARPIETGLRMDRLNSSKTQEGERNNGCNGKAHA